jgi:hypothetical protein
VRCRQTHGVSAQAATGITEAVAVVFATYCAIIAAGVLAALVVAITAA